MASPADEVLPALPPIKTAPLAPSPHAASAADAPSSPAARASAAVDTKAAEDQEPSTPTSEESRLRTPTECPPAPRKPPAPRLAPAAKRKSRPSSTTRVCLAVPRDLSAVFRSMPMPPEKRIRAS